MSYLIQSILIAIYLFSVFFFENRARARARGTRTRARQFIARTYITIPIAKFTIVKHGVTYTLFLHCDLVCKERFYISSEITSAQ